MSADLGKLGTQFGGADVSGFLLFQVALTPAICNANTTNEQSFVVPTLPYTVGAVVVNKPTLQAGLGIVGARIIDATHIGITFINATAGGLTPTGGETYTFFVCYP